MRKCSIDSEVLPTYKVRVYRTKKKLKLGQTGKCLRMKRPYMFLVEGLFSCGSVAMDTGQKLSCGGGVSWELLDANGKGEEPFCKGLPDSVTSGTYQSFGTGTKLRVIPSESSVCIILLPRLSLRRWHLEHMMESVDLLFLGHFQEIWAKALI